MKKSVLLSMIIFAIGALCVSCSSDDASDGNGERWENTSYAVSRYNDLSYIEVPADGGVYKFHYDSSEHITVDTLFMDNNIERNKNFGALKYKYRMVGNQVQADEGVMCDVGINAQDVMVKIAPNNDFTRRAIITLNFGNNKKVQLRFWQKPIGQSNDALKDLVGDWVVDVDATKNAGGRDYTGALVTRYSFHEDGTYYESFNYGFLSYGNDYTKTERGVWKVSDGVLRMELIHYASGYSIGETVMDYRVSDEKFITPVCVFERVENTRLPVAPYYTLEIKRNEENLPYPIKAGEPVSLEFKLRAKSANCTIDKMVFKCYKEAKEYVEGVGYRSRIYNDTIDVSKYMNDKYEFSYPITYPTGDGYFHYTVEYQYTLKLRNGDFTTYGGAGADYMRLIKE